MSKVSDFLIECTESVIENIPSIDDLFDVVQEYIVENQKLTQNFDAKQVANEFMQTKICPQCYSLDCSCYSRERL